MSNSIPEWISMLHAEDADQRNAAAREIWCAYSSKLAAIARKHLGTLVRRRQDEDDVLQSMFKSFCMRDWQGNCQPANGDELLALLICMTLRKAANAANREQAQKRTPQRELHVAVNASWDPLDHLARRQPSPDEVVAISDEVNRRLTSLPDDLRQIAMWRLEGDSVAEIAVKINRTTRTVETKLQRIRERWQKDCE